MFGMIFINQKTIIYKLSLRSDLPKEGVYEPSLSPSYLEMIIDTINQQTKISHNWISQFKILNFTGIGQTILSNWKKFNLVGKY